MTGLNTTSFLEVDRSAASGRDASLYGTLAVIAACIGVLLVGLMG